MNLQFPSGWEISTPYPLSGLEKRVRHFCCACAPCTEGAAIFRLGLGKELEVPVQREVLVQSGSKSESKHTAPFANRRLCRINPLQGWPISDEQSVALCLRRDCQAGTCHWPDKDLSRWEKNAFPLARNVCLPHCSTITLENMRGKEDILGGGI